MKNIFLIMSLSVVLLSCRSARPAAKPAIVEPTPEVIVEKKPGIELNGKWELQKLWGAEIKLTDPPDIDFNFAEKTFTGNTGCNSITGKFTIKENFIAINKEIVTTKMACTGYNEKTFLALWLKINRYVADNNMLELSQHDIVLMKFTKNKGYYAAKALVTISCILIPVWLSS